jgi:DNA polymerase-4
MTRPRRILHVDMDAFFAAVELKRRPELRGRPVVIGGRGDPHARGVVSTATYEARAYGIRSGMALRLAYRLCPQAVFLPVDFDAYAVESARIKAILGEFSDTMEDAGIDEAYLDVSDASRPAEDIARAIQRRVQAETGLTCSVGAAPNKLLAKLASKMEKPAGLTVLTEADIPRRVWPLPAGWLQGVGPKTEARLDRLGVRTIGELAALDVNTLVVQFGEARGRYLHLAARGRDDSPLVTHWEPKSVGHETTFQRDTADMAAVARTLLALAREATAALAAEGKLARRVTVKLRYADFETHSHTVTLAAATDDPRVIRQAALDGLARFASGRKVRLVGVRLEGLEQTG